MTNETLNLIMNILIVIITIIAIISVVIEIIYTLSLRLSQNDNEGFSNQLKFKPYYYPQNPTYMNYEGRLNTVLTGNLL